ncbi:hypothetical protein [Thermoflavimicrobium dichotomicum]|nr:hypothetical protein [Thermoflavimicrobium dichotomicum]
MLYVPNIGMDERSISGAIEPALIRQNCLEVKPPMVYKKLRPKKDERIRKLEETVMKYNSHMKKLLTMINAYKHMIDQRDEILSQQRKKEKIYQQALQQINDMIQHYIQDLHD